MKELWISPSDLSYFWEDSKVGFYDKYVLDIKRPKQSFPSVFNTIDGCMKECFEKKTTSEIVSGAPEGVISHDEIYVKSKLFTLGDFQIGFKGKIDSLLVHDDGFHSVIDYKTTRLSDKLIKIYFLQLMTYAYCLENPDSGDPKKIKTLGLIVFEPSSFNLTESGAGLQGSLTWVEIPFDKKKFKSWLVSELSPILHSDRESIFVSSDDQSWARYIESFYVEEMSD